MSTTSTPADFLRVVKGSPTAEELAALTAVVLALQTANDDAPARPPQRHWARRTALNLAPKPGPGAWRRSRG
ncbi:acyl-CoA carboxylase subunit epsilon [Paeniglutamicibacter antarcticus]|uniref:Acyl-CoA carboxylase subunit epsilon n=1 Tax=Arthrobacter terrae TaxID=2935737 RepID=A0A931CRN0_9MICC|nr:acyl-CoA carboxylase subunit epsilon [Arthrobacter terrae]MBG0738383.1 acyl-CoA carboxylase subunit epsilon [Arthrobacter terrae]